MIIFCSSYSVHIKVYANNNFLLCDIRTRDRIAANDENRILL